MINQRPGLSGRRESRDRPFQQLPTQLCSLDAAGWAVKSPAAVSPFHSEAMTLEPQSGRTTGRASQTSLSQMALPGQQLSLSLSPQAGRQATDGWRLLQLERPTLVPPRRPTPALPQRRRKWPSLFLVWATEILPAGTQVWEMPRTGYPK